MRAMILAAGRGARMRELTTDTPKPLLKIGAHYLIEYSIASLVKIGVRDIVINVSYQGEKIKAALGNGQRYGATFHYSEEPEALETGGGIFQALQLLGDQPFIVLSSDVVTDFPLQQLPVEPQGLAHLVLVDNPHYHPCGDFCLDETSVQRRERNQFTFANIGVYRPELFAGCKAGKFRLGDILIKLANQHGTLTGEHYQGAWYNVGTPEDWQQLNSHSIFSIS